MRACQSMGIGGALSLHSGYGDRDHANQTDRQAHGDPGAVPGLHGCDPDVRPDRGESGAGEGHQGTEFPSPAMQALASISTLALAATVVPPGSSPTRSGVARCSSSR